MNGQKNRLSPELLISAYSRGYFPMPDQGSPDIIWLKPDPRAIIPLNAYHVSRSLQKIIKRANYQVTFNQDFLKVIEGCAHRPDTWITPEFKSAYHQLHQVGFCHSVEIWQEEELVGGTYGVAIRGAFFAESMFHKKANMSKIALYHLVEHLNEMGFLLLECQFVTKHLSSLGATSISDLEYMIRLEEALKQSCSFIKKKNQFVAS
jgi:leucyl/phenylalanyl-tRNA--protein transferase